MDKETRKQQSVYMRPMILSQQPVLEETEQRWNKDHGHLNRPYFQGANPLPDLKDADHTTNVGS
ncbi:hypothetical protein [Paenibacillus sp. N3.4]|uniref:hypothetical protein n=1 Tax=Paenibacillus sp. N3.4 TaxID=2603222 RepID=UPI0011C8FA9E|nr:hypothetical protein [Paenibacillus sp. N3.4]TXK82494.1 hypothetical protein FU659_14975 [Paenibacillus sp. N3.4]